MNEGGYWDDPEEQVLGERELGGRKPLYLFGFFAAAVGIFLNTTLAGNINLSSGDVEFGQGILLTSVCDNSITVTPNVAFRNATGAGSHLFSGFQMSGIDTSRCDGVTFTLRVYDSSTAVALLLFGGADSVGITESGTAFIGSSNQAGFTISETSTLGEFTLTFTNPIALASNVSKITLESSNSNGLPQDNGSSSVTLNTTYSLVASANLYPDLAAATSGSRIYAVSGNSLYYSNDTGTTWSSTSLAYPSMTVATSADGQKVVAAGAYGRIFISTDGGLNWSEKFSYDGYSSFEYIAMSQDGTKILTSDGADATFPSTYRGRVYKFSTNTGNGWQNLTRASIENAYGVAMSGDGSKLYMAHYNGQIWKSTDSGSSWSALSSAGTRYWKGFAVSGDGSYLLGAAHNDYVYLSTDGGSTWVRQSTPISSYWQTASMISSGKVMAVASANGDIFTSVNFGSTWTQITGIGSGINYWYSSAISSDGKYLFLGKYSYGNPDYIYKIAIPGA